VYIHVHACVLNVISLLESHININSPPHTPSTKGMPGSHPPAFLIEALDKASHDPNFLVHQYARYACVCMCVGLCVRMCVRVIMRTFDEMPLCV
jgi:hypothetical protein